MQITDRDFLRHELLNVLMILLFYIEEEKDSMQIKKNELIQLAILIIKHEKILLGERIKNLKQSTSVLEIFEIIETIYALEIVNKKIILKTPSKDFLLKIAKNNFLDAFNYILAKLMSEKGIIEISFQETKKTIVIRHNHFDNFVPLNGSLVKQMKMKKMHFTELAFQIAVNILNHSQIKFYSEPGQIKIAE